MTINNRKKIAATLSLVLTISLLSVIVYAASFSITPDIDASTFNLSESVRFEYDLNVTVNESLVFYSSNAKDLGFNSFTLDNATGVINFTPDNDEVGYYSVTIIAENRSNNFDKVTITVAFNVSNINDAPNITQSGPSDLTPTLAENQSTIFSVNVTDNDLAFGDVLNISWYLDSVLQTINNSFNYTPDFCDSGNHTVTVVVNDTSNENDTLTWNATVTNVNRDPVLNASIANRTWSEGTNLTNNLTLSLFLSDPDQLECSGANQDNITYTATGNSSIQISIDSSTSNVTFTVPENFFGVEFVFFNATDGSGSVLSNNVTLNVTNVNDAPEFNLTNQSLSANAPFAFQLNATDADNIVISGTNNLTYYDNASIFNISEENGVINVTPSNADVGQHVVNITVNDTVTITSKVVIFNVTANDPPTINTIPPNQNATEGIRYYLNVTAVDSDNDNITFTTNFTALSVIAINTTAANLTFIPGNDDVGNHTIEITATDKNGASNTTTFNLEVFNVNNAPNITAIPDQTIRIDLPFSYTVTGSDIDNDTVTFSDNTSLFNIGAATGLISFTPVVSQVGLHVINISATDGSALSSSVFSLTIINNTQPVLSPIGNITAPEDTPLIVTVNASDAEDDTLYFSTNTSFFNLTSINTSSANFTFTPLQSQIGLHWFNITVNDTPLTDSQIFFINITFVNDSPVFVPELTNLQASATELFFFDVNATDEENDAIIFSENSTLFNISNTTGIFNFTPTLSDVGNYSVNFTASDGNNIRSRIINFSVVALNLRPNITAVVPNRTNITTIENGQLQFNVTATDQNNDTLTYSWRLNNTQIASSRSFIYEPDHDSTGFYNMSIIVSDGLLNATYSWNLTVNDSNRAPIFGIKNQTTASNFLAGNASQTNVTTGNITLSRVGASYVTSGNFTSSVIDLGSGTNLTLVQIQWGEFEPENTTITFFMRTSENNATFTNFTGNATSNYTSANGTSLNEIDNRYVQYKAVLETNNTGMTPIIEHVAIHYEIADFEGREDTIYLNYLDLDNFFSDPDGDSLTYNSSEVEDIEVEIDSQGRVSLTPDSNFFGVRTVVFNANDGNQTVYSNNVTLTFIDVSEPSSGSTTTTSSSGGGGGGSSTRIVFVNQTVLVNQTRSIELISPGELEYGINSEITVPLTIKNHEDYTMIGIEMIAWSNKTSLVMEFTDPTISQLAAGEEEEIALIIQEQNRSASFDVHVTAQVTDPWVNDSAVISIKVNENATSEVQYVRDFVQLNPECLELSEVLEQAANEIDKGEYNKAKVLANLALEQCKSLLRTKRINVENPAQLSTVDRILKSPYLPFIGLPLIFGIFLTFGYIIYNRVKWY